MAKNMNDEEEKKKKKIHSPSSCFLCDNVKIETNAKG
jgi:hypothetical protein